MLRRIAVSAVGAVAVAAAAGRPGEARAAAPTAVTEAADAISVQGATLHATVDPGGEPTTVYFQYGTSAAYGSTTAVQEAGAGVGPMAVSATVSSLSFGTSYHYRVVAANPSGQASGEDRAFRTRDAVISGRYAVTLTVTAGGRLFGQRSGMTVRRRYRLTARCSAGSCGVIRLRRPGVSGVFASRLRRRQGDRYRGVERSRGFCDNGERFRAKASVLIYPTSVSRGRAATIAGRLSIRIGGCARGREVATLTGRLVGHG